MKSFYLFLLTTLPVTPLSVPISVAAPESGLTAADVTAPPAMEMPAIWSFNDCIAWATANNTDIRHILLDILQADQDIASAKDQWLPTVGFATTQSYTNFPSAAEGAKSNIYGSQYGVNASWTVWEGNIRKYRLESSKILRRQQELAGEDIIKSLELGILQAYLNIMYAMETVTIAEKTLEVSTVQTERARRLMESGRTSKVDYAQIESQKAQDTYSLVQARNNLETSKMALKKILQLGLDTEMEIVLTIFADKDVFTPLPEKGAVYDIAASWLPNLRSNELNRDIYANDVRIAQAGRLPSISLSGGIGTSYSSGGRAWGPQMGHNLNENIGLSINVPIFDANSTRRAVAKAKLAELDYDLTRTSLLNDLSQTIESLYIDADNARAGYTAGVSRLEAATLTDNLVNRQFELGLVNPLELLTAHNNLLNARLELLQSKYMAILTQKTINYYATRQIAVP
ncbi:MAG: TolC family protein [Muribaculaceae bacterium]|nr:TolC family protein [Muribaculaceae bacterium]